MAKQYRDRAPRRIKLANGGDALLLEGRPLVYGGRLAATFDPTRLDYLKNHAHWGFFEDRVGVKLRYEIGVERMMWSTDFPTW